MSSAKHFYTSMFYGFLSMVNVFTALVGFCAENYFWVIYGGMLALVCLCFSINEADISQILKEPEDDIA